MMKKTVLFVAGSIVAIILYAVALTNKINSDLANQKVREKTEELLKKTQDRLKILEEVVSREELKTKQLHRMQMFVSKSMEIVKPQITDITKAVIVDSLSRVAAENLENQEHQELWIAIIANESGFNPKAKSPAGAIGIGQVMPKSAEWYGKNCGIEKITEQDLYAIQVNAIISVCIFKQILKKVDNSAALALVAYNAGAYSKDLQRIDNLQSINTESANYVAKITRFLEKTRAPQDGE